MPNKEQMLKRHEAHVDRLEYELGLFTSSAFQTEPVDLKDDLAGHVRHALEGEREIVELLKRLESHSSSYTNE
jgi:hypothetical protein